MGATEIEETVFHLDSLAGTNFAIDEAGINQNDVSNFIEKNTTWNTSKKNAIRLLFKTQLENRTLMIYKARGLLVGKKADSVSIRYVPYLVIRKDTVIIIKPFEQKLPKESI